MEEIKKADESEAEPLSQEELLIIDKIIKAFSDERQVYNAAHQERIWQDKPVGAAIPYSEAKELREV